MGSKKRVTKNSTTKKTATSGGRPTKYKPEYCQQLIKHMEGGLSYEAFAGTVGVSKQTIYDWEVANPKFLDAKSIAFEKSRVFWEKLAVDNIINKSDSNSWEGGSESKSRSINSTIWIFNMKNRFGWRDKQPGEDFESNQNPKTDQELEQELIDLLSDDD